MDNKYYTPSIEEFHVGFEYEWRNKDGFPDRHWRRGIIKDGTQIDDLHNSIYELRVKYLDFSDLKELKFKHVGGKLTGDVMQLFTLNNGRYFVHLEVSWFSSWVVVGIETSVNETSTRTLVVHSITINNKSELIVLMKQLNIA